MTRRACSAVLVLALLCAGNASAATPPESRSDADQLAELVFDLGLHAWMKDLKPEAYLAGCARVPLCAGECAESFKAVAEGALIDRAGKNPCPSMKPFAGSADLRSKAVQLVRARIGDLAAQSAGRLGAASRDRLDCGLARLALGNPRAGACQAAEARLGAKTLVDLPPDLPAQMVEMILPSFCRELEFCAGPCAQELSLVATPDWSSLPVAKAAADATSGGCAEFGDALKNGPPEKARERALAWVRARIHAFARGSCATLGAAEQSRMACALPRLGVARQADVCGTRVPSCEK
jgi:hypothetical protein